MQNKPATKLVGQAKGNYGWNVDQCWSKRQEKPGKAS